MEVERKGACGGLQRRLSCERDEEGSGRLPLPNSAAVWVAGAHKAQPCRSGAVWAAALQMREARWATAVRKFTVRAASSGEWKAVCGEILLAPPLPTSLKVDTEDPEKPRIRAPLDLGPNPALEQVSNLPKPQFLICTAGFGELHSLLLQIYLYMGTWSTGIFEQLYNTEGERFMKVFSSPFW